MQIRERASNFIRTARSWLKAILTIALAWVMLTAGFYPWTTQSVTLTPESALYGHQSAIQQGMAFLTGLVFATLLYFGGTGRRFGATTVLALIGMGAIIVAEGVVVPLEEKLGPWNTVAIVVLPMIAAVATKAANISSQKRGYMSIRKKFENSLNEARRSENMAELFLWFIAWTAGVFAVLLLSEVIKMW